MGLGQKTTGSDVKEEAKNAAANTTAEVNKEVVNDDALDKANGEQDPDMTAAEKALEAAKKRKAEKDAKKLAEQDAKKLAEQAAADAARAEEEKKMAAGSSEESEVSKEDLNNAKPVTTKEVATKTKSAPPAVKQQFSGMALASKENALPALDFGTLPRFKASPAGIKGEEGSLGKSCEATVVSYNNTFAVAPNSDGAPKELCKFSTDGVNLNDGSGLVADHVAFLKEEGYDKASSKRYVELIAILDDAENDHEEIGNMVTFSLSPMSVKSFERYRLQCSVKIGMNPNLTEEMFSHVKITAKPKSFGNKDFVMLDFSAIEK